MVEIKGVSQHANFYPMLSDEAIAELAADIKENGQQSPITVTAEGVLLDGRNRLKACELAGVEPQFSVYEGDDEGAFVRSSNERRHQSTGSRAMSTALSLQADGLRNNGRWKRGSVIQDSELADRKWQVAMNNAGVVLDELPNLAQQVVDGTIALDDAYKQARTKRQQRLDAEEAKQQAIRDEQQREDQAGRYFDNHPDAKAWLDTKPQGAFETMRGAYAAYMEHDREARREEQRKREAEQREKQELEDRRKRIAARLSQLAPAVRELRTLREQPVSEREAVLAHMSDFVRTEFEEIEKEITC